MEDYALHVWRKLKGDAVPPEELFVSAQSLDPSAHVRMQAAAQALIDSSISKTVNVPEDIDFTEFADIYRDGYRRGCKGMTTYRPNAVTGSVLSVLPTGENPEEPVEIPAQLPSGEEVLQGTTYKLKWPDSAHAVYVTINNMEADGEVRPFEIFVNSKNMEHYAWTLGLTRMISAVFRRGRDMSFIPDELKAVFDPRGGAWMNGKYVPSLLAAIGGVIERHLEQFAPGQLVLPISFPPETKERVFGCGGLICPQCAATGMIREEGCNKCLSCGYSKCG